MKKLVAILLLCLFALLLIAARPRPCKTRSECFFRYFPMATPTFMATETITVEPIKSQIENPTAQYMEWKCDYIWPGVQRCGWFDITGTPVIIIPLPPPSSTAPPAGYP